MKKCVAFTFLLTLLITCFCASRSEAAETVIVADRKLRPVVEIISGIRKTLASSTSVYSPAETRGKLRAIVERERAKVVVALGSEALKEALQLPPEITVVYDLVATPPKTVRSNVTGFYIATPVKQYLDLINTHLRSIKRITVIGTRDQLNILVGEATQQITQQSVINSFELTNALRQTSGMDAILLLPDVSLLTAAAIEEAYLLSFRKKIPLLGISEKQVKEGALLALVADTVHVGRQIGDYASKALKGVPIGQLPPSPPRRFELFLNTETARKMGIRIPDELLRMAKRVYP